MRSGARRSALFVFWIALSAPLFAGDFLFVSPAYLRATEQVVADADHQAPIVWAKDPAIRSKYTDVRNRLMDDIGQVERTAALKKGNPDTVSDRRDAAFANDLNGFKDGLNAMSRTSGQPLDSLLPHHAAWTRLEAAVVQTGLDQRLAAFNVRYGPDSEPNNILEWLIGQKMFPGTEAGPSAWEPIARVSAVQFSSRGPGLTSTVQVGMNHYFVHAAPPKPLRWLSVSNHVGVAAMVQYLDHPGLLSIKGRPSFGVMVHLDRKEAGVSWNNADDRLQLTLGYAFQFVPFVL